MNPIETRLCDTPKEPAWLTMRQALWPEESAEGHRAEMAAWCGDPARCAAFLATGESGNPVGFVEVALRTEYVNGTTSSPVGYVEGLYVVPAARKQGVARALMGAAEGWVRDRGCRELVSDVAWDNRISQAAHQALGFRETERTIFYVKGGE